MLLKIINTLGSFVISFPHAGMTLPHFFWRRVYQLCMSVPIRIRSMGTEPSLVGGNWFVVYRV